jgi:signal recognition particle GTPase
MSTNFLSKNLKWFTIIFFVLFLFKGVQSCNRKTQINMGSKVYIEQLDLLKKEYKILEDSIKDLKYELILAKKDTEAAERLVNKMENTYKSAKTNTTTTIVVTGAEEVKDTIKNKK